LRIPQIKKNTMRFRKYLGRIGTSSTSAAVQIKIEDKEIKFKYMNLKFEYRGLKFKYNKGFDT
jgi:hypothetical protein